jgi:LysR family glycine cleavage system transcriptional activator
MRYNLPPLPALQAFEAAARHENFAAAAQELNLSQSAVSHRVRLLERHLDYPLFERLPRGLRLTESAKAYLPTLRKAFEDILGSTTGIFGSRGGTFLTVRAPITYTALWLSSAVDRFTQAYPNIEVRLISSVWADKLAADETDIDLRLGYGRWPGFEAELLFRDPIVPVCSRSTLEAMAPVDHPEALAGASLIHVMGTDDHWAKFFAEWQLQRSGGGSDIRVDSSMTAAEMACAGDRLVLLHKRFTKPYFETGRLVQMLNIELQVDEALYMLLAQTRERRKPEATLFYDWLLQEYRQV